MNRADGIRGIKVAAGCVSILLLFLALAVSAEATAIAGSRVTLNWSDARFVMAPGMSLTFDSQMTTLASLAATPKGLQSGSSQLPDWGLLSFQSVAPSSSPSTGAEAAANSIPPEAGTAGYLSTPLSVHSHGGGDAHALSQAVQEGTFTVSGSGDLFVQIPFSLELDLATANVWELAGGSASAFFTLTNTATQEYAGSGDGLKWGATGAHGRYHDTWSGILSASAEFSDGQSGTFTMMAYSEGMAVSTPEPSTFLLLGWGMVAGLLLRQRWARRGRNQQSSV